MNKDVYSLYITFGVDRYQLPSTEAVRLYLFSPMNIPRCNQRSIEPLRVIRFSLHTLCSGKNAHSRFLLYLSGKCFNFQLMCALNNSAPETASFILYRASIECCFFQNQGLCWSCRSDVCTNYIFFYIMLIFAPVFLQAYCMTFRFCTPPSKFSSSEVMTS